MSVINVGFRVETRRYCKTVIGENKLGLQFLVWSVQRFDLNLTLDLYLGNIDVVSVVE